MRTDSIGQHSLLLSLATLAACVVLALGAVACGGGDGGGEPAPDAGDTADTTDTNQAPVAEASGPSQVTIGTEVTLDASGSTDPDGDELTFAWSLEAAPQGSSATLQGPNAETTTIELDAVGNFDFELTVDDGRATSTDTITVTATNQSPTADAGSGATVIVGTSVNLDGSASSDPDGDSLSYTWSIISAPDASTATISNADQATASLTPDAAGDYTAELEVSDGTSTDTDRVTITASPSEPDTVVYVRESGADDNPGTEAFPVTSLPKAVTLAENTSGVQRINLDDAAYTQGFEYLVDSDLTIVGQGSDLTVLDAAGSTAFKIVDGGSLTLIDLAVEDASPAIDGDGGQFEGNGWRCEGGESCILAGGLFGPLGTSVNLTDSTLTGSDGSSGTGVLYNNGNMTMSNTTVSSFQTGVSNVATGLRITDSTVEDCETGVLGVSGTSESIDIIDSTFTGNDIGIDLTASEDTSVQNSTFEQHTTRAIVVKSTSTVVITDTEIATSARSGIRGRGDSVITLANCTIHDNGTGNPNDFTDRAGVYLAENAQLSGSDGGTEIYGHPQDNIVFQGNSGGTLSSFDVHDASAAGVYANTTGQVTVDKGSYSNNENGFFVSGDTSLNVDGATVSENSLDGINYQAGGELEVRGTDVTFNERNQFYIAGDPSSAELHENLIEMASGSNWGILDARSALGSAIGTTIDAARNTYRSGSFELVFENSSLDGQFYDGPVTYDGASAGDENAVFKIENTNREMSF